ncbi:MAG: hypothetical protein NTX52_14035 [Planctomycetota bacterium]|nr:hypothetical protein [Planctomycetota bacterium]
MRDLRKRDLIADLRYLLTRQEDGGQVLVWPKEKGQGSCQKMVDVPIIPNRYNLHEST